MYLEQPWIEPPTFWLAHNVLYLLSYNNPYQIEEILFSEMNKLFLPKEPLLPAYFLLFRTFPLISKEGC